MVNKGILVFITLLGCSTSGPAPSTRPAKAPPPQPLTISSEARPSDSAQKDLDALRLWARRQTDSEVFEPISEREWTYPEYINRLYDLARENAGTEASLTAALELAVMYSSPHYGASWDYGRELLKQIVRRHPDSWQALVAQQNLITKNIVVSRALEVRELGVTERLVQKAKEEYPDSWYTKNMTRKLLGTQAP